MDDVKAPDPYTEIAWRQYVPSDEERLRIQDDKKKLIETLGGIESALERWPGNMQALLGLAAAVTTLHGGSAVMSEEAFVMNAREAYRDAIKYKLAADAEMVRRGGRN